MAETGSVTVKIGEERIKEMIKDSLADAWDAGAQCRWETHPSQSVKDLNPFRDPEPISPLQ